MFNYKNLSSTTKTFYGVVFPPGQSRIVPGPINTRNFVRLPMPKVSLTQEPSKKVEKKKVDKAKVSEPAGKPTKSKPGPKPKIRKDEERVKKEDESIQDTEVIEPDVSDKQDEKEEGGKE